MSKPPNAQLKHIGLFVRDLEGMIAFYTRLFGLVVTDTGAYGGGRIAFLSRNPDEHHQLVLASGRPEESGFSPINQISFLIESLEDLRQFYAVLVAGKAEIQRTITHGNAWAIYFFDPEGNRVEIYAHSPWYVAQPFAEPIDLTESAEALLVKTEALLKDNPTRVPMETWSERLRAKIDS